MMMMVTIMMMMMMMMMIMMMMLFFGSISFTSFAPTLSFSHLHKQLAKQAFLTVFFYHFIRFVFLNKDVAPALPRHSMNLPTTSL